MSCTESYKQYLIRETLTGETFIEKGGTFVAWADSVDVAKVTIDLLTEETKCQ